jgi:hypothetical protein
VAKARAKIGAHHSERIRHALLEYLGFLENNPAIPGERIYDLVDRAWTLRESLVGDNGCPYDDIFCYAIEQTIKYKGATAGYIGRVINDSVVKWRDGCFKGGGGKGSRAGNRKEAHR